MKRLQRDKPPGPSGRKRRNVPGRKLNPAGFLLLEIIVAMILLGTAAAIIVPALSWMGTESRLSMQKQEAVEGLYNLMEDLTARPYEDLTPDAAAKIELPKPLQEQLPGAKLEVAITETETAPKAKRIQMRLSWNQRSGQPLAPLRLSAWVHQTEGRP